MATLKNEPRRILADRAESIGASPEQIEMIERNGWTIAWASRPLIANWQSADGEFVNGPAWEKWDGGNHGFYVAGDPDARVNVNYERTIADVWNSDDAYPIELVTPDTLKTELRGTLGDDFDTYLPQYVDMNHGDEHAAILEMAKAETLL